MGCWSNTNIFFKHFLKYNYVIKLTVKLLLKLKLHMQVITNLLHLWVLAVEELSLLLNVDWNVLEQGIGLFSNVKKFNTLSISLIILKVLLNCAGESAQEFPSVTSLSVFIVSGLKTDREGFRDT